MNSEVCVHFNDFFSEDTGCRHGAYAEDIVLIFPSAGGLRILMTLFVNINLLYMEIKGKLRLLRTIKMKMYPFYLNGVKLENVTYILKYLGCVLKWKLGDSDIFERLPV